MFVEKIHRHKQRVLYPKRGTQYLKQYIFTETIQGYPKNYVETNLILSFLRTLSNIFNIHEVYKQLQFVSNPGMPKYIIYVLFGRYNYVDILFNRDVVNKQCGTYFGYTFT